MSEDTPTPRVITLAFVQTEKQKLESCWLWGFFRERLEAEFSAHEAALMNRSDLTEAELRHHTGQMAGLRTALVFLPKLEGELRTQERLNGDLSNAP